MAREQAQWGDLNSASALNAASITVTITPDTTWADRVNRWTIIGIGNYDTTATDNSIVSVTVGGVAATQIDFANGSIQYSFWRFKNPPKTSYNVVVTFTATTTNGRMQVIEVSAVDPLVPIGLTAKVVAIGTHPTVTLNPTQGVTSYVLSGIAVLNSSTTTACTVDAPFATWDAVAVGSSPNRTRFQIADDVGDAATNLTPGYTIAASKPHSMMAVEVMGETLFPQCSLVGMGF